MATRRLCGSTVQLFKVKCNFLCRSYNKLLVRIPTSNLEKMTLEFYFPLDDPKKKKKHFKFERSQNEEIDVFLNRLKTKINVEFEKKFTRNNKKNLSMVDLTCYAVNNASVTNSGTNIDILGTDPLQKCFTEKSILRLNGTEYITIMNTPLIISIKLPKVIVTNCSIVPILKMEFGNLTDLYFEWFISNGSSKWKLVHRGAIFTPSSDLEFQFLRVIATCDKTEQTISVESKTAIIKCPNQDALNQRWRLTETFVDETDVVRLMTYNVLADVYGETATAKSEIFRHCPKHYLSMEYRQHLLIREICNYHTDVICLQEVDCDLFENFFLPIFRFAGYDGFMMAKCGFVKEGQAVFWRQSKLSLLRNISVPSLSSMMLDDSVTRLAVCRDLIRSSNDLLHQWLELRQCMAGCVLATSDGRQLMIANTHLFFQPTSQRVRLLQMAVVLCHLEMMKEQFPQAGIVLCGDFNDRRGSDTLEFIERSKISINDQSGGIIDISHQQPLVSAYDVPFTNFVPDFNGELDFIFYDRNRFSCTKIVPLPSLAAVTENVALPNEHFPSDHLALVAELKMSGD